MRGRGADSGVMRDFRVPFSATSLAEWMDLHDLTGGQLTGIRELRGGTQNLMYSFCRGGQRYVLRRPPRHPRSESADIVRREVTALSALEKTDVPHPRLLAYCEDPGVIGTSFYLMAFVEGYNPVLELPAALVHSVDARKALCMNAVDSLARLGMVDYVAAGLTEFGKPEGFLERQVPRWLRLHSSYQGESDYRGEDLLGVQQVAEWLGRHIPSVSRVGLMHGDFHLGNLLFNGEQVAAVLDWEMATIGDPLLDLGRLLAQWPDADHDMGVEGKIYSAGELPTAAALAARYCEVSGLSPTALNWYVILGGFKLAIILEGTYARACAGKAERQIGERLHRSACNILTRSKELMSHGQL